MATRTIDQHIAEMKESRQIAAEAMRTRRETLATVMRQRVRRHIAEIRKLQAVS